MRSYSIGIRALALLTVLTATPASAYVLLADDADGTLRHLRWAPGWTPIHFLMNDRPLELLPNLASGSMPVNAIEAAMNAWAIGPVRFSLDGTVTNASRGAPGASLITFADTPQNRDIVGNADSAVTVWFRRDGTQRLIVEADIVLNPRLPFATDGRPDAYDVQDRLTRALGRSLGLANAPVAADAMYPFNHLGKALRHQPSIDDIAGVRALYGLDPAPGEGAIRGQVVTEGGDAVFGAYVTAIDADGIARVGVLSDRDGHFTVPSLPAGVYQVYAEPLDGPMTPANLPHAFQSIRHDFRMEFAGGNLAPAAIKVAGAATTDIDPIQVVPRAASVKVEAIGWSPDGHSFSPAYPQALQINPGRSSYLEITGGAQLAQIDPAGIRISGSAIDLDQKTLRRGTSTDGTPFVIVQITARPDAPLGPRSLYLSQGDTRAVLTGGIEVVAP